MIRRIYFFVWDLLSRWFQEISLYIYIGRYIQSNCIHLQQTNLEKLNHLQCDWPRSIYYCEQVRVFSLQAIFLWNGIWVICFCWPGGLSWFDIKIGTLPEANKTPEKIGPWKRRFRTWKPPFLGTKMILFQGGYHFLRNILRFFPNVYSIRLERFERTPAENRCHLKNTMSNEKNPGCLGQKGMKYYPVMWGF